MVVLCAMCGEPGNRNYGGGGVCSAACFAAWKAASQPVANAAASVLEEARLAIENRGETYGPPRENHERTANLWSIYLRGVLRHKVNVSARDVCLLNILQKVARDIHRPKRDNLVDIAGYAENANLCEGQSADDAEPPILFHRGVGGPGSSFGRSEGPGGPLARPQTQPTRRSTRGRRS